MELKFKSLTFSPKKRLNKIFVPDLDLSNILTVNSAKAIEREMFPIFFLAPSYEKNILTKISPISISVSCTTLKSTLFDGEFSILVFNKAKLFFMLACIVGIIAFNC